MNGGRCESAQLETDFLTAPGAAFTVTATLATSGELWVLSQPERAFSVDFLTVSAVRSDRAEVVATDEGFTVQVPNDANASDPVRVEFDVELPSTFAGGSMIGFDSFFCETVVGEGDCDRGYRVSRGDRRRTMRRRPAARITNPRSAR